MILHPFCRIFYHAQRGSEIFYSSISNALDDLKDWRRVSGLGRLGKVASEDEYLIHYEVTEKDKSDLLKVVWKE